MMGIYSGIQPIIIIREKVTIRMEIALYVRPVCTCLYITEELVCV